MRGRKYCKFRCLKFPLHHFHQDTSSLLHETNTRVWIGNEWLLTVQLRCCTTVRTSGIHSFPNCAIFAPLTKRVVLARTTFLSSASSLSHLLMLDGLQGKFHITETQMKLNSKFPHSHFTETGQHSSWCSNYHSIALRIVVIMLPDRISRCHALCLAGMWLEGLYLQQLSFSLVS